MIKIMNEMMKNNYEPETEIDKFMTFFNQEYPHSALGNISPIETKN